MSTTKLSPILLRKPCFVIFISISTWSYIGLTIKLIKNIPEFWIFIIRNQKSRLCFHQQFCWVPCCQPNSRHPGCNPGFNSWRRILNNQTVPIKSPQETTKQSLTNYKSEWENEWMNEFFKPRIHMCAPWTPSVLRVPLDKDLGMVLHVHNRSQWWQLGRNQINQAMRSSTLHFLLEHW